MIKLQLRSGALRVFWDGVFPVWLYQGDMKQTPTLSHVVSVKMWKMWYERGISELRESRIGLMLHRVTPL